MPSISRRLAAAGAGLSAAALMLFTAAPSHATVSYASTGDPVRGAAGWLATQFVDGTHLPAPDGDHFDQKYGSTYYANQGANADVLFGLAAGKVAGSKIAVALAYLADNVDAYSDITNSDGFGPYDGSVAKLAVAAIVAGQDPTAFGGYNLLHTLATDECAPTAKGCTPGSGANVFSSIQEAFIILAEARAGAGHAPTTQALDYFTSLQCASGGFTDKTASCGAGDADVDATSYAIMALQAAGGHATELARATAWLTGQRKAAGYWVSQGIPNANSTGLAAAALQGQNFDVEHVPLVAALAAAAGRHGRSGCDPLRRQARSDHHGGHLAVGAGHRAGPDRFGRRRQPGHGIGARCEQRGADVRAALIAVGHHGASRVEADRERTRVRGRRAGRRLRAQHAGHGREGQGRRGRCGQVRLHAAEDADPGPAHGRVDRPDVRPRRRADPSRFRAPLRPRRAPRARSMPRRPRAHGRRRAVRPRSWPTRGRTARSSSSSACSARWPSPAVWSSASPAGGGSQPGGTGTDETSRRFAARAGVARPLAGTRRAGGGQGDVRGHRDQWPRQRVREVARRHHR